MLTSAHQHQQSQCYYLFDDIFSNQLTSIIQSCSCKCYSLYNLSAHYYCADSLMPTLIAPSPSPTIPPQPPVTEAGALLSFCALCSCEFLYLTLYPQGLALSSSLLVAQILWKLPQRAERFFFPTNSKWITTCNSVWDILSVFWCSHQRCGCSKTYLKTSYYELQSILTTKKCPVKPKNANCVNIKLWGVVTLTGTGPFLMVTLGVVALSAPVTPW